MLGFHIPAAQAATHRPAKPLDDARPDGTEINAWLVIDKDGTVTIRVPHTEMGQGGMTSVALLIAEELNVDWSKIKTVFADANRHLRNNKEYNVMSTHGSQLVRTAASAPHAGRRLGARAPQGGRRGGLGRRPLARSRPSTAC